jgi:hypothetical protein
MAKNTTFSPNPDLTAQITGSGASVPGSVSPTYAATQAIASILQYSRFVLIAGVNSVSATTTITTTFVAKAGARLAVQVNAAGGTVTATFSTGFRVTGTAAPTIGTSLLVDFVSDGTTWNEIGRSAAVLT